MLPRFLFQNEVEIHLDPTSLQYLALKMILVHYEMKIGDHIWQLLPPNYKEIIRLYNPLLICNLCSVLNWDIENYNKHTLKRHPNTLKCIINIEKL